jgi:parvulin-like peptidyl-prolyl isomerase
MSILFAAAPLFALQPADSPTIVAKVGDQEIYADEVESEIAKVVGENQTDAQSLRLIQATALDQLVKQQLVATYLKEKKFWPNETQLNVRLGILDEGFRTANSSLEQHLQESGISTARFRQNVAWRMGWQTYLDRYLTDENIARYFDEHRASFDGTKIHVAHLLIKVEKSADEKTWQQALEQATKIRNEITSGETTFAEAVRAHSQAATADQGGDLGMISRHAPMPESFSRAAFDLKIGEISEPVSSAFGFHLIHCLAVEPGSRTWQDVRQELTESMKTFLFDWVAQKQAESVEVQYTDAMPHLDPQTGQVAK